MPILEWNEKYSVNIAEIDRQHQQLIGHVNELNKAMRSGKGRQVLESVLKALIQYTQTHFATEEQLMKTHCFPDYLNHRHEHQTMTQKVLKLQEQYNAGNIAITIETMNFLREWLDQHIMGTDKKYSVFLNGKGVT
jgi:hemerythrin